MISLICVRSFHTSCLRASTHIPRAFRERKDAIDTGTKEDRRNHAQRILNFKTSKMDEIKTISARLEKVIHAWKVIFIFSF